MTSYIVVGTDGSRRAKMALDTAAAEAQRRRMPIKLIYGYAPLYGIVGLDPTPPQDVLDVCNAVLDKAEKRMRTIYPDARIEKEVKVCEPALALVEESDNAEMIVVGARGLGAVRRLLLGSVSTKVATYAHCPVMVVRGPAGNEEGPVVVGIAPEDGSPNALRFAFEEASIRGVPVVVIQSHQHAAVNAEHIEDFNRRHAVQAHMAEAENRCRIAFEAMKAKFPAVEAEFKVLPGHAIDALVDASENACLVVVGSHGKSEMRSALLGSVSMGVLHGAPMVAVVREHTK